MLLMTTAVPSGYTMWLPSGCQRSPLGALPACGVQVRRVAARGRRQVRAKWLPFEQRGAAGASLCLRTVEADDSLQLQRRRLTHLGAVLRDSTLSRTRRIRDKQSSTLASRGILSTHGFCFTRWALPQSHRSLKACRQHLHRAAVVLNHFAALASAVGP